MPKERLESWKAIAVYLKRSPRTVQRWHAENGLPVNHFGGSRGPVFAFPGELDAWLSGFAEVSDGPRPRGVDSGEVRRLKSAGLTAEAEELWDLRGEENLCWIAGLYRQAMDQDPRNAAALLGFSNSMILASLLGVMRSSGAYPRATEAMKRALRVHFDPAPARCTGAWLQLVHERRTRAARDGFDEVRGLQPGSSMALSGRGLLHVAEGDLGSAAELLLEAWKLAPLSAALNGFRCWVEYLAGNFDQAIELAAQARASGDNGSVSAAVEALCLVHAGAAPPDLEPLEKSAQTCHQSLLLQGAWGYACAISGQTAQAAEIVQRLKGARGGTAYPLALVLVGLDEPAQAISFLEDSFAEGSLWSLGYGSDPTLEPLREMARFKSLLRKMGSPA